MSSIELEDFDEELPDCMTVSVVMEKRPSDNPWIEFSYKAIGVIVGQAGEKKHTRSIFEDAKAEHILVTGLQMRLHEDECESYYHNLMSPKPGCYVVAETPQDPDQMPEPYLVSMSFDEVHAYLEGDEQVYAVEIPRELYQWAEAFILTHYVAVKKTKRKLKNWHEKQGSRVS